MNTAKLGVIFVVAAMALAGIGASYSAWFDTITVHGTVSTGSVDWDVTDYSGTYVWKIHGLEQPVNPDWGNEIYVDYDHITEADSQAYVQDLFEGYTIELISHAIATAGAEDDEVTVLFDNLFPCIWFKADIEITYTGTIPGKISDITYEVTDGLDWVTPLVASGDIYATARDAAGNVVEKCYQMHENDVIYVELWIHIPQDNDLMLKTGSFTASFEIKQWNEVDCDQECSADLSITKVADNYAPTIGQPVEYTITVTNNGPCDATGVVVTDVLPDGLTYSNHGTATGSYDYLTGVWTIGSLANGGTATLQITATVTGTGTTAEPVELGLIIDGSGSIDGQEWALLTTGLITAIQNDAIFPKDGSVELTIVQFSTTAQVELPPTIVTEATEPTIVNAIQTMVQLNDYTNIQAGFMTCADAMAGSINHLASNKQVINLVTDGVPNRPVGTDAYIAAVAGRDYLISTLGMTDGQDEIDAEGVGIDSAAIEWLRDDIVYPQEGNVAPPYIDGWILPVDSFDDFQWAVESKFGAIFTSIENCAEITSSSLIDPNPNNNIDCITITPQPLD